MGIIEIGGISIFLAFAAGMLSVLSPCLLPLVPAYLGYLTGAVIDSPKPVPVPTTTATTASVASGGGGGGSATIAVAGSLPASAAAPPSPFLHAIAFVTGFSLIFIAFGASIGLLGFFLGGNEFFIRDQQDTILKVSGGALIILGLHLSGVITIPFLETERRLNIKTGDKVGYTRSFIVGSSFSAGWSPCIGPTLGAVLALSAASASVWQGLILLAVYSAGLAIPFLAMGLAFNSVKPVFNWLKRYMGVINYASGALLIIIGILIFTGSLINLNSLFNFGFLGDLSAEA
ncbi:MAG: cytochrome c biogenesis protein CcdA [Chloroflexi bacterium]|nr:cytochrome c biogenesis protein CcdA [Chloroflexota bacterium]